MAKKPTYEELEQKVRELEKDADECKQTEQALEKAEQEKAAILDSMTEHVVYHDMEHKVLWANKAAGESVDLAPRQLVGRYCYEIWQRRAEPCLECPVVKALETGRPQEAEMTTPDGKVWFIRGNPIRDANGNITGGVETTLEITEWVRAQEALRESEEKYRNLADSITDVFFALDGDLKYTYWNEASERLTGTSASHAIGKQILEIFPDNEETRRALEAYQEVLRTQQPRSFVNEYHLGGKRYFFEISAYPSPHGLSVFVKDITEQKKVEEALRESKELFEKIFISQLNAIFILNSEAPPKIIDCNPATTKIFGYSREEMLGRTTALLHVSEATLKEFQENLYLAIEGHGYCHLPEFEMKRKDGTMFPTEHSVVPLRGEQGRCIGWVSVVRDISECKRTIDALEEGEKKYRDLVENIKDVIYSVDKNGVMTYINPAVESVLGYSPSEIIGKPFLEFIYKEDLLRVKDRFKEVFSGRIEANEYRVLSKSGEVRWIFTSSKPVFAGNDVIGVQGVLTDITERKRAEEALREREAELEIKTNSLEEVNTALKVLLKRRDEDKRELEEKVLSNMKELALPYLEKLKKSALDERQRVYIDVLESNLNDIISPFLRRLSSRYLGFTPAEIQVANLIRHGKTTKEIAEFLNLSSDTIDFHRKNIRNKIGIKNKKTNLRTHLLSME